MARELLAELYGDVVAIAAVGVVLLAGAWVLRTLRPAGGFPSIGPAVGIAATLLVGVAITGVLLYAKSRGE